MKHAGPHALDRLEPLLAQLRTVPGLREKQRGTFYRGSQAWLHFHEDGAPPTTLWADRKEGSAWLRRPVEARAQWEDLLAEVRAAL